MKLVLNAAGTGNLVDAVTPAVKYSVLSGVENVVLYTGQGNDTVDLKAVAGDQNIWIRDGNDTISVGSGQHYLDGGNGTDTAVVDFHTSTTAISGLALFGTSTLSDAAGLNSANLVNIEVFDITGGTGNDRLFAYGGGDTLRGGLGNDILYGGGGNDVLYGGTGAAFGVSGYSAGDDVFRFSYNGGQGVDSIMDAAGGDLIKFDSAPDGAFGSIAAGNGSATANHAIELETKADGYTYLYFGTDNTAGADITMKLFGAYAANAFQIVNTSHDLKVVLGNSNPGTPGDDILIGTSGNDTVDGGAGNDKVYGKEGDDTLGGGAGNDLLVGGMGHDTLTGGDGADTLFVYAQVAESMPSGVYSDFISDFTHAADKIDLSAIDANPVVGGNQAFDFIGTAAFSGAAGELRWENSADPAVPDVLQMDVNGDGVPEMQIQLAGATTGITATDFVL